MEHLEGITVLNEYIQNAPVALGLITTFATVVNMAVVIIFINALKDGWIDDGIFGFLNWLVIGIFIIFTILLWDATLSWEDQIYEVLVGEEVSATEFMQTYHTREIKGEIYVVEFKNMEGK